MSITLAQICNAIETTLGAATALARSQSYDELTEGMNDLPTLQVYPESGNQDPGGATDRTTFRAGVRQTQVTIFADYYARARSHIGEDMAALVDGIDAITNIVEQQDTQPYFSLAGIKTFSWSWQRVIFEYGDPLIRYAGVRFTFVLRVF